MTTKHSPLSKLKAQADKMAMILKATERGEHDDNAKIVEARTKSYVKFAVVMDDKVLSIEMAWATIKSTSEAGISEYILKKMRESRETTQ